MLDYNPNTKQYLVKRVHVPNHVLEANRKEKDDVLSKKAQIEPSGSSISVADNKSVNNGSSSDVSDGEKSFPPGRKEGDGSSSGSEGEAGPASDGEQKASQPEVPKQEVSCNNIL